MMLVVVVANNDLSSTKVKSYANANWNS